jgi:hypothetical protein
MRTIIEGQSNVLRSELIAKDLAVVRAAGGYLGLLRE